MAGGDEGVVHILPNAVLPNPDFRKVAIIFSAPILQRFNNDFPPVDQASQKVARCNGKAPRPSRSG